MTRFTRVLPPAVLTAALAATALTGCTGVADSGDPAGEPGGSPLALQGRYIDVVENVLPSVVEISTPQAIGSGIIYDDRGHIVTNAHVVGDSRNFQVTTTVGGQTFDAVLVGSYPADDLAVIKVDGTLPSGPPEFADSSELKVGQIVLAMGNPLGLNGSVSQGIVSAVGRTVREPRTEDSPGTTIPDMIQTTAAINPGNSGGALVDLGGHIVGIPTLAATTGREGGAAPGIGFAISSNTVKNIADQLIATGEVTDSDRAALGMTVRTVIDTSGQPVGVGVATVSNGGPAEEAGIRSGDVITAIDGEPIPSTAALTAFLAGKKPGDKVMVSITRGDESLDIPVTLGEL